MNRPLRRGAFLVMAVLLAAVLPGARPAYAGVALHVKPGGAGSGGCATWATACSLQYALSVAVSGDQLWVKKGVYRPTLTTDRNKSIEIPSGVAVYGGFAGTETALGQRNWKKNITVLSGDIDKNDLNADGNYIAETWSDVKGKNSYNVVWMWNAASSTVLDGFTITGGKAIPSKTGGGLYCYGTGDTCSPILENLVFSGNMATSGGGLFNLGSSGGVSSPSLTNVVFRGNKASYAGGGMYNAANGGTSSPVLTRVTFINNEAQYGGAVYNYGEAAGDSSPTFNDVSFTGNRATECAGAVHNDGQGGKSSPEFTNVTFSRNAADGCAGAIYNFGADGGKSSPTFANVTFQGNDGGSEAGALYNDGRNGESSPTLTNVTFSGNHATGSGGAIFSWGYATTEASPTLVNVILWGDTATSGAEMYNETGSADISYSIVQGGCAAIAGATCGSGNLDANPKLKALAKNGGYTKTMTLNYGSPAVDAGTNTGCADEDQRGLTRPQGDTCDIGAVEARYKTVEFKSQGAYDGWVRASDSTNTAGGAVNAGGTTFKAGDDVDNRQYRAILSFDTSALPDQAVLKHAVLTVMVDAFSADAFAHLDHIAADIKKGAFGTSAALQRGDFQAAASLSDFAEFPSPLSPPESWLTSVGGVSGLESVNLAGLTQFRLRFDTPSDGDDSAEDYSFFSGDSALANRPILRITFIAP